MQYEAKLKKDDNGTMLVTFPTFNDAVTFGEDTEEALFRAQGALAEAIASRIAAKESIPHPKKTARKGCHLVPIDAMTEAKLRLYWEMKKQGVRKAELARRMGYNQKQVDRLLDVTHNSQLNQITNAFSVLGKRVTIQIRAV